MIGTPPARGTVAVCRCLAPSGLSTTPHRRNRFRHSGVSTSASTNETTPTNSSEYMLRSKRGQPDLRDFSPRPLRLRGESDLLRALCASAVNPFFSAPSGRCLMLYCRQEMTRQVKIIVEKHADGYVAYPLGLKGVVVGEGDSYEQALADVTSAIRFHMETFGAEVLPDDPSLLEAFIAEATLPA